MLDTLQKQFDRDLDALSNEINAYSDEATLWVKQGAVNNTAGNLAMHICGNLQHFIGSVLDETGYQRNRPFEFEGKIPREELINEIDKTKSAIRTTFIAIKENDLKETYPFNVFGHEMSIEFFLIHLHGHLNYHLGQITYHRRLLD